MPDIFDEIEEDFRADRARRLAKSWGGVVLGVALLALAGVGGWQYWRYQEVQKAEAAAASYVALHRGAERPGADLAATADGFAAIGREAPGGYRVLARLRAAALKAETGDGPAAQALWAEVANDTGADALYRDLATLLSVLHAIDSGEPEALAARIAPLTEAGNPWRASAQEAAALIALKRGATAEARRMLEALAADGGSPPGLRERAQRLAAGLRG